MTEDLRDCMEASEIVDLAMVNLCIDKPKEELEDADIKAIMHYVGQWAEETHQTEPSAIQDNYPAAPERVYYHLTKVGIQAGQDLWPNPLFTLYPEIGPSHMKKPY